MCAVCVNTFFLFELYIYPFYIKQNETQRFPQLNSTCITDNHVGFPEWQAVLRGKVFRCEGQRSRATKDTDDRRQRQERVGWTFEDSYQGLAII